jgi:hypothetical protein
VIAVPDRNHPAKNNPQERVDVAAFAEIIVGLPLSLILYALGLTPVAELTAVLGPALSGSRYLLERRIAAEMAAVHSLAAIIDLEANVQVRELQEMCRVYLEVTEDEFRPVKKQLLLETIERLRRLALQKKSDELSTGEYYNWLLPMIDTAAPGSTIWAVSMMLETEWNDSPYEDKFLALNMAAAKRGVHIERVFVVDHANLQRLATNKGIAAHLKNASALLTPLVVFRDDLAKADPTLVRDLGDGFIAFDDRCALVDMSSPEGMRGYVTLSPGDLQRLKRKFERLCVHGRELTGRLFETSEESK